MFHILDDPQAGAPTPGQAPAGMTPFCKSGDSWTDSNSRQGPDDSGGSTCDATVANDGVLDGRGDR